jgi:glycerophosphoryl diester phosphodiesterase
MNNKSIKAGTWGIVSALAGACISLALAAGCAATHTVDATAPAEAKVIIQSHRGAGKLSSENTLEAYQIAWRIGTVPEVDIRTSKDGVLVGFHDDNFNRVVKDAPADLRKRHIEDLTWAELSKLDVGAYKGPEFAGHHIPRMDRVFEEMRGRPERLLYLDFKKISLEQLAEMVRHYGIESQVILASTDYGIIREWARLAPKSRTLLWMGGTEAALKKRLDEVRATNFAGISQLQIHVKVGDLNSADPFNPSSAFLRTTGEELRAHGVLFQTLPLTPETPPAVYQRLMDLGVQSFATDDPMNALQATKAYVAGHRQEGTH